MIDCGSLFQGICTVRSLRNISIVEALVKEPVSANNATASTVAFIAPGPPNPPITQVLYVGVTWTGNGPFRSEVPAVSSRSLDSSNLFQVRKCWCSEADLHFSPVSSKIINKRTKIYKYFIIGLKFKLYF